MKKVILFLLVVFLSTSCMENKKTIVKYDLVSLNDKMIIEKNSSGTFFIFMASYRYNETITLKYRFFYKDKYGCITFKELIANDADDWKNKVYIVENNDKPPAYVVKTYSMHHKIYHYLIVPTGTITNDKIYEIDLE